MSCYEKKWITKDSTYSYISIGIVIKNIKIFDRVAERKRISIIISLMLLPAKLCSDYAHHVQCFQLKSEYVVQSLVINYTV
jgi:hypothetical protein